MSEEDMIGLVSSLAARLKALSSDNAEKIVDPASVAPVMEPKASIKERSVTCLVCGKVFKVMTKKHLAQHGMDAASYREAFGFKKGTPLTCKELQRARRAKMKDMRLWEKRAAARAQKG